MNTFPSLVSKHRSPGWHSMGIILNSTAGGGVAAKLIGWAIGAGAEIVRDAITALTVVAKILMPN